MTSVQLPAVLDQPDDAAALEVLQRYFRPRLEEARSYTGSAFGTWDSTGTRAVDINRFSADDLVAVSFLSVSIHPRAAHQLLRSHAEEFSDLLMELGPDRDLVDEEHDLSDGRWVGWRLHDKLLKLHEVGPTRASKLLARKRPRLRPVYDSVVAEVTGTSASLWRPLQQVLRAEDCALHLRLLRLRDGAGLPEQVSALRVWDVLAWMEGKARGL